MFCSYSYVMLPPSGRTIFFSRPHRALSGTGARLIAEKRFGFQGVHLSQLVPQLCFLLLQFAQVLFGGPVQLLFVLSTLGSKVRKGVFRKGPAADALFWPCADCTANKPATGKKGKRKCFGVRRSIKETIVQQGKPVKSRSQSVQIQIFPP